jgi:signal transduction histidine kinase
MRDEFLVVAAHDLKTPLGALGIQIEGMRKLAEEKRLTEPVIRKGLNLIERQTGRLIRLVRGLLELSRIHQGRLNLERTACDLAEIVRDVCDRYAPVLEKARCTLECGLDAGASGSWDRDRLEQVVENLLSNAAKFGPGRPIRIEVVAPADGRASLTVSDQGIGIPDDQQTRIFERFERGTSSPHYGGMGMGLFIVRKIVEAHGGTIRVASSPHHGTSFTVELPQ